jgi:hypothetical protein
MLSGVAAPLVPPELRRAKGLVATPEGPNAATKGFNAFAAVVEGGGGVDGVAAGVTPAGMNAAAKGFNAFAAAVGGGVKHAAVVLRPIFAAVQGMAAATSFSFEPASSMGSKHKKC